MHLKELSASSHDLEPSCVHVHSKHDICMLSMNQLLKKFNRGSQLHLKEILASSHDLEPSCVHVHSKHDICMLSKNQFLIIFSINNCRYSPGVTPEGESSGEFSNNTHPLNASFISWSIG